MLFRSGDAQVYGDARVYGNAWAYGYTQVHGDAQVYGDARAYGNAWVYGSARVYGCAQVFSSARVYGDARVSKTPIIITGFEYTVTIHDKTASIGCQHKDIDDWLTCDIEEFLPYKEAFRIIIALRNEGNRLSPDEQGPGSLRRN